MPKNLRLRIALLSIIIIAGILLTLWGDTLPDENGWRRIAIAGCFLVVALLSLEIYWRLSRHPKLQDSVHPPHDAKGDDGNSKDWNYSSRIFDFTPAIITLFDVNSGRYEYVSNASLTLLGYKPSEVLEGGFNFLVSLVHPEDRDAILAKNSAAIEKANREFPGYDDNEIIEFEYRMRHKDGSYRWINTFAIVFSRLPDNRVDRVLNISMDISTRKNSEDSLRQARESLMSLNNDLEEKIRMRTAEIKAQKDEFRSILLNAPYMISIRRGPELRLDFINKAYERYSGRYELGIPFAEIGESFKKHKLYEAVWDVYRTGIPYSGNALYVPYDKFRNGEIVDCWYDFTFLPVFDAAGKVDGVATFGFEVTDLINANKEVKKNEDRFRFLANAIPQKVWTATPDGRVNYMNEVWAEYSNLPLKKLMDNGWRDLVHPDELEETIAKWDHALATGRDLEMENRFRNARGDYRWHLVRARAQRDEKGEITLWVGTNTDINDNKRIEQDLKISEEYFRQLADQTPFMIWKVDKQGLCNYVNRQWIDYTGLSYARSTGLGWGQALHPDDQAEEYRKFMEAFEQRKPYHSKFRIRGTDGRYRWFLAESNPLKAEEFNGYIGSLSDITEQELVQQHTHSLLEKKDEFMSIASHELKTPISSMKAYLQIAERMAMNSEYGQLAPMIQKANKQVIKLTSLVENLLDVSRIQAGRMEFSMSEFPIGEAITDSIEQVQSSNQHRIEVNGNLSTVIHGDKYRVEQVIVNLLHNAIKYSPGKEMVQVHCVQVDGVLRCSIKDFGIGIPEDKKNFVFDRFFRVHESSQNFSGLGLGLYISSEIVKRHGGSIGVESEEGKGSEFWFTIPVNGKVTQ